ncbi:hypothetical protein HPG69_003877, partial [Diceros bicornis minor]
IVGNKSTILQDLLAISAEEQTHIGNYQLHLLDHLLDHWLSLEHEASNHPNIMKLSEVTETQETLYLVMEYTSGREVFDYLLDHSHTKEKETSFNNELTFANKLDIFCGNPPYATQNSSGAKSTMAPQGCGLSGVICYVMVTRSLPFNRQTFRELWEWVLSRIYHYLLYMSVECENLLKKFLILNPSERHFRGNHEGPMNEHRPAGALSTVHPHPASYSLGSLLAQSSRVSASMPFPSLISTLTEKISSLGRTRSQGERPTAWWNSACQFFTQPGDEDHLPGQHLSVALRTPPPPTYQQQMAEPQMEPTVPRMCPPKETLSTLGSSVRCGDHNLPEGVTQASPSGNSQDTCVSSGQKDQHEAQNRGGPINILWWTAKARKNVGRSSLTPALYVEHEDPEFQGALLPDLGETSETGLLCWGTSPLLCSSPSFLLSL